jgi:hypothetical protein
VYSKGAAGATVFEIRINCYAAFFAPPLFAAVKLNWCETPLRKIRAKRPVSNVSENLFCDKQLVLNFLRLAPLLK